MKLQIAFDDNTMEECITIGKQVSDYIDIIELGTPLVYRYGVEGIKTLRKHFPDKTILADFKIVDAGGFEAEIALEAGADITTLLAASDRKTIEDAVTAAKKYGGEILVDLINTEDISKKVSICEKAGVDYVCVHTGVDRQALGDNPMAELIEVKSLAKNIKTAIAGGVSLDTIASVAACRPDIIIIGAGLTKAENPAETARRMREAVDSTN